MPDWFNWIPLLLTSLIALGNYIILAKKATPEIQKIRSETESEDANAVESYANTAKVMQEQLTEVRKEVKALRSEIYDRDKKIMERDLIIDDLKDWAERLIYQLHSINKDIEPVPFKPGSNDIINV